MTIETLDAASAQLTAQGLIADLPAPLSSVQGMRGAAAHTGQLGSALALGPTSLAQPSVRGAAGASPSPSSPRKVTFDDMAIHLPQVL